MNSTLKSLVVLDGARRRRRAHLEFLDQVPAARAAPSRSASSWRRADAGQRRARHDHRPGNHRRHQGRTRTSTPTRPTQYEGLVNKLIERGVAGHGEGADGQPVGVAALFLGAVPADDRLLGLLHAPDAERRQQGAVVRQEQGEAVVELAEEGHVQGRRRRRRSEGRAAGDHRVPQGAAEVPEARRPHSEGRAADGPSGNRQDAAGARGRRRSERAVLLDQRLGLRRDVRRRRRVARPRPVRAGQEERALHRLHRRDRRGRPPSRRRPRRRSRRARADAQPAARRDGRLRVERRRHPRRRDQPSRRARSGAAASRPLRSPHRRQPSRREGPRRHPRRPHPQDPDGRRRGHRRCWRAARPASPAPISRTW